MGLMEPFLMFLNLMPKTNMSGQGSRTRWEMNLADKYGCINITVLVGRFIELSKMSGASKKCI